MMPPAHIPTKPGQSHAFTNVELLTVLSIVAVLGAFVVPVIGSLGKSSGLNTTGNKIMGLLNYAHQNSMTKEAMTAVVLCEDGNHRQLFTLFELVAPTNGNTPQTSDWHQLNNWEALPEGLIVDPKQASFLQRSHGRKRAGTCQGLCKCRRDGFRRFGVGG